MSDLHIAVLGSGANGAGIGSDLLDAGLDVTFVEQWPAHVEAMREHGITVHSGGRTTVTPVETLHLCQVAEVTEPFDLVFLVTKAYDTRWSCELIRSVLAPDGIVVGLQNGMTAHEIAAAVGVERTLGAVIEVGASMFEPGVVTRDTVTEKSWFALGALEGGPVDRVDEVAAVLGNAGTVEVFDDILSAKWMKLVVNAAELVSAAIVDLPMVPAARLPGMREFMIETGAEALRAGLSRGHEIVPIFGLQDLGDGDPTSYVTALIDAVYEEFAVSTSLTTVHQDWMKGRRSEVLEINGLVVEQSRRTGDPAPANEVIVDIALEIEAGRLEPGQHLLPRLLAATD
jgi:2-dehydropantoate 2-reductase